MENKIENNNHGIALFISIKCQKKISSFPYVFGLIYVGIFLGNYYLKYRTM